jgi:hypothetical protein
MRLKETIEVRQNLKLYLRERGKIVSRREGHNIFLDLGREWLAQLISFQSLGPDVAFRDDRIKYMGFGIGGNRQLQLSQANAAPISPPYVGTNAQTDTDESLTVLERPVRVGGSSTAYPGLAGDMWLGAIGSADPLTIPTQTTFRRLFTQTEISYGPFSSVPLSEVGLFTSAADPENYQNTMIAYDTFDTISKTAAFELEVIWTIRF